MTDFQFLSADGTTTDFTLRTDFIGANPSTENLTVCDIIVKADPSKFADTIQKIKYGVGELKQKAADWGLGLTSEFIGNATPASKINQTLQPVTNFALTVDSATQITADWTKSPNATGYVITRATDATFETDVEVIVVGDVATYVDAGLTGSTHYYYRIAATLSGALNSAYAYDDDTTQAP